MADRIVAWMDRCSARLERKAERIRRGSAVRSLYFWARFEREHTDA